MINAEEAKKNSIRAAAKEKARAKKEAEEQAIRDAEALAQYVARNVPFFMTEIEKRIQKSKKRYAEYSFSASESGHAAMKVVKEKLEKLNYSVSVDYSAEEYGRAAYDEMDSPASYDMTVSW